MPKFLLLGLLFSAVAISIFVVSFIAVAQPTPVQSAVQAEEKAYAAIREADSAGANMTTIAPRFNVAIGLLENASRLEKQGDPAGASLLASQAENSFLAIAAEAQNLRDAAVSYRQQQNTLRTIAVPTLAIIVALAVVALAMLNQRIKAKQFAELRIRLGEEDEGKVESS